MKKTFIVSSALLASVFSAFTISVLWKADAQKSTINFELPAHGKKGTFSDLTSTIDFDPSNLKDSKISATIDVKTIKVGSEKHDAHLLSADFFDAEKFPKITFISTEIKSAEKGFVAKGNLTMKDSTKAIELPFNFTQEGNDKATFNGTMTINGSDYGILKANKPGADKVIIYLYVPASK